MAALLAGQSVCSVAKQYNLPKGTVSGWRHQAEGVASGATQKKEIGDRLLEYLQASLTTLTAQVRAFSDEEWLKKQPASEVAVLHGVIADKAIRLLEALAENADDGESSMEATGRAAE